LKIEQYNIVLFQDAISRTPIQIDGQVPVVPMKLYNHVTSPIIGPDLPRPNDVDENRCSLNPIHAVECDGKRTSGVEPSLDPTTVLTALVENNNGRLPPYQL
jgi:hypothetical protein